jgi:hypothetical protein
MFLKWFSHSNEYGISLITGLLRHIRGIAQVTETELVEMGISFAVIFP